MTHSDEVRLAGPDDVARCVAIVEGLPEYFTPDVPEHVATDMRTHRSWVATADDEVIGFAVVSTRFPRAAEVLWAGVAAERRGAGIGTALVTSVLAELAWRGIRLVEVKTLDPSADYHPYKATFGFWLARGFLQIDTIDPPLGWEQSNPAAVLVAVLA